MSSYHGDFGASYSCRDRVFDIETSFEAIAPMKTFERAHVSEQ